MYMKTGFIFKMDQHEPLHRTEAFGSFWKTHGFIIPEQKSGFFDTLVRVNRKRIGAIYQFAVKSDSGWEDNVKIPPR